MTKQNYQHTKVDKHVNLRWSYVEITTVVSAILLPDSIIESMLY